MNEILRRIDEKVVALFCDSTTNGKRNYPKTRPHNKSDSPELALQTTMKTNASLLRHLATSVALCIAALSTTASGQTTATTIPVGFITTTLPIAPSASSPSNTTISVPLYTSADFAGAVLSVDSTTTLTLTGANFSITPTPIFADVANPRLVRVKTSSTPSHVGKFFVVTTNTANQLTLKDAYAVTTDITSSISAGDTCEVLPANTLGKLFGVNAAGATSVFATGTFFKTGASATLADNLLIWTGSTWASYYNNNTNWKTTGFINQNNTIIYPDEGLFVIHRDTTSALTLTLMGTVPSTAEQTALPTGSTFLPNRFPTDTTLLASGIQNSPNWLAGPSAANADKVFIWNGATWGAYYWNGTNWKTTGFLIQDGKVIPAGTAIFITRSSASGALTQALPYVP